jgi:hypothetical protein
MSRIIRLALALIVTASPNVPDLRTVLVVISPHLIYPLLYHTLVFHTRIRLPGRLERAYLDAQGALVSYYVGA